MTTVPHEKWENLVKFDKENGYIDINVCITEEDAPIAADKPLVLTFTFDLAAEAEYAGLWIPHASAKAVDYDLVPSFGTGVAELAEPEAEVSSDPESSETSKPETGDTGVIVFAVLGFIALAGVAVVVKSRH